MPILPKEKREGIFKEGLQETFNKEAPLPGDYDDVQRMDQSQDTKADLSDIRSTIEEKKGMTAEDIRRETKEEKLRQVVTYCFRKLILNKPNDKTREEVKKRLMEVANDLKYKVKFKKVDQEANVLRDKIVDLMEKGQLDSRICPDVENWLRLLFDDNESTRMFCKQEAVRITNELIAELSKEQV